MYKNGLKSVAIVIVLTFLSGVNTVFAISAKTSVKKNFPTSTFIDNNIQNIITSTFNKLIEQILPKDKLAALLKFSSQLTYDPDKEGLQPIYLPLATDGSATYSTITNLSTTSFISDTATVNSDLSVAGSAELQGNVSLGATSAGSLQIGSTDHPTGITIYDRTTRQPVCVFSDNKVLQISAGACSQ